MRSDVRLADVRREVDALGCPYRFSDEEVRAAIEAECAEWDEHSRRIRALLKTKGDEPREPIPAEWIIDRAARRLWDDMRLPCVFIRAEYMDRCTCKPDAHVWESDVEIDPDAARKIAEALAS